MWTNNRLLNEKPFSILEQLSGTLELRIVANLPIYEIVQAYMNNPLATYVIDKIISDCKGFRFKDVEGFDSEGFINYYDLRNNMPKILISYFLQGSCEYRLTELDNLEIGLLGGYGISNKSYRESLFNKHASYIRQSMAMPTLNYFQFSLFYTLLQDVTFANALKNQISQLATKEGSVMVGLHSIPDEIVGNADGKSSVVEMFTAIKKGLFSLNSGDFSEMVVIPSQADFQFIQYDIPKLILLQEHCLKEIARIVGLDVNYLFDIQVNTGFKTADIVQSELNKVNNTYIKKYLNPSMDIVEYLLSCYEGGKYRGIKLEFDNPISIPEEVKKELDTKNLPNILSLVQAGIILPEEARGVALDILGITKKEEEAESELDIKIKIEDFLNDNQDAVLSTSEGDKEAT